MRTHTMIAIVQVYIHIRKGIEVQISVPKDKRQLLKLIEAYGYAKKWMEFNNVKMTNI